MLSVCLWILDCYTIPPTPVPSRFFLFLFSISNVYLYLHNVFESAQSNKWNPNIKHTNWNSILLNIPFSRVNEFRCRMCSTLFSKILWYFYIYIYIYIYVWKLNQTVLELDFRAVKCLFFPRRDSNPHHWYTAAPFA